MNAHEGKLWGIGSKVHRAPAQAAILAGMDDLAPFLHAVATWVHNQEDILAVGLVGSWARGTARADSDVDLVLIVADPDTYMNTDAWVSLFGPVSAIHDERWGPLFRSKRLHYRDRREVEFGFTTMAWAATEPLDAGTRQVVADGLQLLYDPRGVLHALAVAVEAHPDVRETGW